MRLKSFFFESLHFAKKFSKTRSTFLFLRQSHRFAFGVHFEVARRRFGDAVRAFGEFAGVVNRLLRRRDVIFARRRQGGVDRRRGNRILRVLRRERCFLFFQFSQLHDLRDAAPEAAERRNQKPEPPHLRAELPGKTQNQRHDEKSDAHKNIGDRALPADASFTPVD